MNTNGNIARHIVTKLFKANKKEKNLKDSQEKKSYIRETKMTKISYDKQCRPEERKISLKY